MDGRAQRVVRETTAGGGKKKKKKTVITKSAPGGTPTRVCVEHE